MTNRKRYGFEIGMGAVHISANVLAESREDAVELLQEIMPENGIMIEEDYESDLGYVEYAFVGTNPSRIDVNDVVSETTDGICWVCGRPTDIECMEDHGDQVPYACFGCDCPLCNKNG